MMPIESGRTFGIFDLTGPALPVRSRLYSLQPQGLGTPYCESLSGYITRLAEAHRVRTREFLTHEIFPHFTQRRPSKSRAINESKSGGTDFLRNWGQAVNGTGAVASTAVWVLETLTSQTGLQVGVMSGSGRCGWRKL
jgi:hypothetical protein